MHDASGKILMLESDKSMLFTAKMTLKPHFQLVQTESNAQHLKRHLEETQFDVIVLDMNYSYGLSAGKESLKLLRQILDKDPHAHVLMTTAYGNIELAAEALTFGAIDFLVKPCPNEKLLSSVKAIYRLSQMTKIADFSSAALARLAKVEQPNHGFPPFKSGAMKSLIKQTEIIGQSGEDVLIEGPRGTDKETIARLIHLNATNAESPFITLDLREVKIEDQERFLFGDIKHKNEPGFIEMAKKGSIYLQAIEMLTPQLLSKLLTTIQFKQIVTSKTEQPVPIATRFICSTSLPQSHRKDKHPDLSDFIDQVRLKPLQVPPLYERPEDIEPLLRHYLKSLGEGLGHKKVKLSSETLGLLQQQTWPKNEMQLKNAAERALMVCSSSLLLAEDFGILPHFSHDIFNGNWNMEDIEKITIQKAIRSAEDNLTQAAKELGIGRSTLYRKMSKFGLTQ